MVETSYPRYKGFFGRRARRRCLHSWLDGLYGDEINHVGGWRLFCYGCSRFLDGPVDLSTIRLSERKVADA